MCSREFANKGNLNQCIKKIHRPHVQEFTPLQSTVERVAWVRQSWASVSNEVNQYLHIETEDHNDSDSNTSIGLGANSHTSNGSEADLDSSTTPRYLSPAKYSRLDGWATPLDLWGDKTTTWIQKV